MTISLLEKSQAEASATIKANDETLTDLKQQIITLQNKFDGLQHAQSESLQDNAHLKGQLEQLQKTTKK